MARSVPLLDWLHPRPIPAHGLPARTARQRRRDRRARRGRGVRTGIVPEEAEDDDDVPVTVDEADDEVEVDDLA